MTRYVGVDLHRRRSLIVVLDADERLAERADQQDSQPSGGLWPRCEVGLDVLGRLLRNEPAPRELGRP